MKKIYLLLIFIGVVCFSFTTEMQAQVDTTERQKPSKIEGLRIYPNPSTGDKLYITSEKNLTKTVRISTVLGEQILFKVLIGNELDISSLPQGVYAIQIKEGNQKATRKFVRN